MRSIWKGHIRFLLVAIPVRVYNALETSEKIAFNQLHRDDYGPIGYDKWSGIFSGQWMKVLTFAVIAALLYHVWVGMRDVLMDYVKPVGIRLVLQILVIIWLVACAGWAVQVLWRV